MIIAAPVMRTTGVIAGAISVDGLDPELSEPDGSPEAEPDELPEAEPDELSEAEPDESPGFDVSNLGNTVPFATSLVQSLQYVSPV